MTSALYTFLGAVVTAVSLVAVAWIGRGVKRSSRAATDRTDRATEAVTTTTEGAVEFAERTLARLAQLEREVRDLRTALTEAQHALLEEQRINSVAIGYLQALVYLLPPHMKVPPLPELLRDRVNVPALDPYERKEPHE